MRSAAPGSYGIAVAVSARRLAAAVLPLAVIAALCREAILVWAAFPTWPTYDSQYALLWAEEVVDGTAPGFDDYRAPTSHPLLIPVGLLLSPFGADTGGRLFVGLMMLSLVTLIVAMYRLGRATAGVLGGLAAAGLLASRLDYGLLATIGFLDIPYCALIAWAAVMTYERPRRDFRVLAALTLAGLLRPEAWLLAAAYALWAGLGHPLVRRVRLLAAAATAPAVWSAVDLAVTGDPLFSLHHTDALATELGRERPLLELPGVMLSLLTEIVKLPVLGMAAAGALLAIRLRNRSLVLPGALVGLTCATYLVIASGGLAIVYRYLLVAGLGVVLFAAYALTGWTTLARGSTLRRAWACGATVLVITGAAYTVGRTSTAGVIAQLRERAVLQRDLRAVLTAPAVADARRCGPLTVPNHKLIPQVRAMLGLRSGEVVARSDRSLRPQTSGVAIVIDRRIERRPALDVWEVPTDGLASVMAPDGFRPLAGNRRFAAWSACA